MKLLLLSLLLLSACGLRAQTDLPGPVRSLPDDAHTTPNGVCSWDKVQSKKVCLIAGSSGITTDHTITVTDGAVTIDTGFILSGNIIPTSNLAYAIGFSPSNEWSQLSVQNLYNYGPSFFGVYSDIAGLIFDGGCAAPGGVSGCPILFYTHNIARGGFDDNGMGVNNLAGTGTRIPCTTSVGYFTNCAANTNLTSACSTVALTGSYQNVCALTVNATGVWLITAAIQETVSGPAAGCIFALAVNGALLDPALGFPFATLAETGEAMGQGMTATVSQTWTATLNSGDLLNIKAVGGTGTSVSGSGWFYATYLHP